MKEFAGSLSMIDEASFIVHYEEWANHAKLVGPVVITKRGVPAYVFMDFERFLPMLSVFAAYGASLGVPAEAILNPPKGGTA
ncbi:MAG: hypothetical protein BWY98_00385 [Tenericutes bacterium ADurb.BinA155]|jgi:hypothetical protein|nr:MAG: hypothetical protein BWY98_00385 [Tenericutes bacterium ADurb.BinA155]